MVPSGRGQLTPAPPATPPETCPGTGSRVLLTETCLPVPPRDKKQGRAEEIGRRPGGWGGFAEDATSTDR